MPKVIRQGTTKIGSSMKKYLPKINTLTGISLAELPCKLNAFLAMSNFKLELDNFDNPFIINQNNERVSLALAITLAKSIHVYNRESNQQIENTRPDIIGSLGYSLPSIFYKIDVTYWGLKIKSIKIASEYAWEITDDDKKVIMPVIIVELEPNTMTYTQINSLLGEKITSKLQVVINELS